MQWEITGKNNLVSNTTLNNLSNVSRALGYPTKSFILHDYPLIVREDQLGKTHEDIVISLNKIDCTLFKLKEFLNSLKSLAWH